MGENSKVKILGCDWYSPFMDDNIIGIVVVEDIYSGIKAYIGNVRPNNTQEQDLKHIYLTGAKFNVRMALELCGIEVDEDTKIAW